MNDKQKQAVSSRLSKVEGQVRGIQKMINDDRYCIDILSQTRAVSAAIRKIEDLIMEQHLNTCVLNSMRSEDKEDQKEKITEIMDVLSKFRKNGN
jgi:CsoR family transcriptional regulator, copper-sensing transcriptional repressor